MATKKLCDGCEREIPESQTFYTFVMYEGPLQTNQDSDKIWNDICQSCMAMIVSYIGRLNVRDEASSRGRC